MSFVQNWNAALGCMETVQVADNTITATNKETAALSKGQAVYISGDGQIKLASNDADATRAVAGLVVSSSIAADAAGLVQAEETLSMDDWTSVTGAAALTAGAQYYLGTAGGLTATAPSGSGKHIVMVGRAVSHDVLKIEIQHVTKNA